MSDIPDDPDFIEVNLDEETEKDRVPSRSEVETVANAVASKRVRRLKANELVGHGDFVGDGHQGLKRWEGPGGFRADAFVKPIYRLAAETPPATKESK